MVVELWLSAGLAFLLGVLSGVGLSLVLLVRAAKNIAAMEKAVKATRKDVRP